MIVCACMGIKVSRVVRGGGGSMRGRNKESILTKEGKKIIYNNKRKPHLCGMGVV